MSTETAQTVQSMELPGAEFIFGSTVGMAGIRERIEKAFLDDLPVLIEGESGTGKEVIGRFLHSHSSRRKGPFQKFNCAAAPAMVIEAEIYGLEKGASLDRAVSLADSVGLASGGTLFFDEIGGLDVTLQRKLAGTLASGNYRIRAGEEDRAVDARCIFATSEDLSASQGDQSCLETLLRPFAHHHLRLLPLRERKEDIPQLCEYLLGKFASEFGRPVPRLSGDALEAFRQWKWPGNIRELENWIARIVIFGAEEAIGLQFSRQLVTLNEPPMRDHAGRRQMSHLKRIRRFN